MLDAEKIEQLFVELNSELEGRDVIGEVGICGGAVMCLVFKSRLATKDVDGIFAPAKEIRDAVAVVGRKMDVPENWLNDAAKGFFTIDPPKRDVLNYTNLRVWAPRPEYMLAMKCISARFDSYDKDDLIFLVKHLQIASPDKLFDIVMNYYPEERIPVKTRFFVEELFQELGATAL
ncbi:hypothetical protein ACFLS1_03470 [Verrucomicrobiota bacterium]